VHDIVACRLCTEPVARDAEMCPACGVKKPWMPDEPTINPRLIRVAMWGDGVVVLGLLLLRRTHGARRPGPAATVARDPGEPKTGIDTVMTIAI